MRPDALLHRLEYGAIALLLAGLAYSQREALGWPFWLLLVAPDLCGLLPASLMGTASAKGGLPPRGVWLYNRWHTYTLPLAVLGIGAATGTPPWPVLGWLLHLSVDRVLGYGLRGADGFQGTL
jgi:hypothetical protein